MSLLVFLIILTYLFSSALGAVLILKPEQAIELQKRFYVMINWRLEPINMALELRNTRIMGFMVIGAVIACIGYTIFCTGGRWGI